MTNAQGNQTVIIDTHTFLWWVVGDPQLSQTAQDIVSDTSNRILLNSASAWEIAIKYSTGKLTLPLPPDIYIPNRMASNRIEALPIEIRHAVPIHFLPPHHKDPFDRILIAQAIVEGIPHRQR